MRAPSAAALLPAHQGRSAVQGRLVDAAGSAGSFSKAVRSQAAKMEGEDDGFDMGSGDDGGGDKPAPPFASGPASAAAAAAAVGSKLRSGDQEGPLVAILRAAS